MPASDCRHYITCLTFLIVAARHMRLSTVFLKGWEEGTFPLKLVDYPLKLCDNYTVKNSTQNALKSHQHPNNALRLVSYYENKKKSRILDQTL